MQLRREVQRFAEAMEMALQANDHKPGWKHDPAWILYGRVVDELWELRQALTVQRGILNEAVDVANFLMMICDVCDELGKEA